jgi:hypothetical protein
MEFLDSYKVLERNIRETGIFKPKKSLNLRF